MYDLGGGHFAEGTPGKTPGGVLHSPQFSPEAMAQTGWKSDKAPADSGADSKADQDVADEPPGEPEDGEGAEKTPSAAGPSAPRRAGPADHALAHQQAEDKLAGALGSGKATDEAHTLEGQGQIWTGERAAQHNEIIQSMIAGAAKIPSEGKAVLLAGLGTGKPEALAKTGAIDSSRHALVSTEQVKGEMAKRGMIPEVDGLRQGESTALVHKEAAHVAGLALDELTARRKNVVVDGAMTSASSAEDRIDDLRRHGYSHVAGIHLSTPVDKAVERARSAHARSAGKDVQPGPRLAPSAALRMAAESHGADSSDHAFEEMRPHLDRWEKWDHSGKEPVRAAKGGKPEPHGLRSVEDLMAAREAGTLNG
jgi:Zeta toxin